MKKNISLIFILVFGLVINGLCQVPVKETKTKAVNLISAFTLKGASFYEYNPPYKALAKYNSKNEVSYNSPEDVLSSIISTNSLEWDNQNRLPNKQIIEPKEYKVLSLKEKETTYFELLHKFTFISNGIEIAYIKYRIVENNNPVLLALAVLKKVGDRWYIDGVDSGFEKISNILWVFKSDKLNSILKGEKKNEDSFLNEVIDNCNDGASICNMDKLFELYNSWKISNNQVMISYFTDSIF
ncbi:MAG TPA: hypothetical protein VIK89_00550 [Cytophagaceae bacterium]